MTAVKFSGTFKFKNLDQPNKQLADSTVYNELEKYHDKATFNHFTPVQMNLAQDEDTFEIQVYNSARILGRNVPETLPDLDQNIKASLNDTGIPYTYTSKLQFEAEQQANKRNWLQKALGLGKKEKS